ncbi:MAG: hypothetical protein M1819_005267 [Sarea resinae]|nr:MAG: hypothetical protein M1819_005267 [Sarea resinae]
MAAGDLEPRAIGDLCVLYEPRSAIVGSRLYFMGGNYTFVPAEESTSEPYLYYLDLNTTFPVETFIPNGTLNTITVPMDLTPNIRAQTANRGGAFFTTPDSLYVFAGLDDNSSGNEGATSDDELAVYNTTTGKWSKATVAGGNYNTANRQEGLYASQQDTGLSFFLGGDDSEYMPGMVRFDASTPQAPKWTNQTSDPATAADLDAVPVPHIQGGQMAYVPMGKAGVLIVLGGYDMSHPGSSFGSGFAWDLIPLSNLTVYDIFSSTFHRITLPSNATVPSSRSEFCVALSAAPDYSSFQITLYGGWNLFSGTANEEVWVLTIPAFEWIQIHNDTNNLEAAVADNVGRSHHQCHVFGASGQMVVLGGKITEGGEDQSNGTVCSSAYPPVRVLDTSTYAWKTQFDPSVKYSVPGVVTDVIGGNSSGNATSRQPQGGFSSDALSSIFKQTLPMPASMLSASTSTSTSTPTSSTAASAPARSATTTTTSAAKPAPATPLSTGAKAGIAIGALAGVFALVSTLLYLYRRHTRGAAHTSHDALPSISGPLPMPLSSSSSTSSSGSSRPGGRRLHELDSQAPQAAELYERSKDGGGGWVHEVSSTPRFELVGDLGAVEMGERYSDRVPVVVRSGGGGRGGGERG